MLLGVHAPCMLPRFAAFPPVLAMWRGAVPEGGTPDPLTYVLGCVEALAMCPKGASVSCCFSVDIWAASKEVGWELRLFSCRGIELCVVLFSTLVSTNANPVSRGASLNRGLRSTCDCPFYLLTCYLEELWSVPISIVQEMSVGSTSAKDSSWPVLGMSLTYCWKGGNFPLERQVVLCCLSSESVNQPLLFFFF